MKQKFRRGKPPITVMERGDQRPSLKKAIKKRVEYIPPVHVLNGQKLKPMSIPEAVDLVFSKAGISKVQLFLCPLCMKPMTEDNVHDISVNNLKVRVHKTCPT